ncbi:MAG: hypothetical protein J6A15_01880 [Clostridia bacterium]|nr:hypothetical protein [Clostridia bacterium]
MKQVFTSILKFISIVAVIALGVLLVIKIKNDTLIEKNIYEENENIQLESEYIVKKANDKLASIIETIEAEIDVNIELADSGSISELDIYFVTKVENDYRYIVKKVQENGTENFAISQDNNEDGRYIVSLEAIGLDECIYTDLADYNIDKQGVITYLNND